jgi:hypothetical protein
MKRLSLLLLSLLIISCSTNKLQKGTPIDKEESVVVEPEMEQSDTPEISVVEESSEVKEQQRELIDGFRVKVDAVDDLNEAKRIKGEIAHKFNVGVYIDFLVDKYYVYAGDCTTRDEAEILKSDISSLGYKRLYVFPKKVYRFSDRPIVTKPEVQYSVNLFSGESYDYAVRIRDIIEKRYPDDNLIVKDGDQFLVYSGKFNSKDEAQRLKDKIVNDFGLTSASIEVVRDLEQYNPSEKADDNGEDRVVSEEKVDNSTLQYDTIVQLFATSSKSKAIKIINELKSSGFSGAELQQKGTLYKVLVKLNSNMIDKLRVDYPDLFVVKESKGVIVNSKQPREVSNDGVQKFYVQLGAFSTKQSAEQVEVRANDLGYRNIDIVRDGIHYKVVVGGYYSRKEAEKARDYFRSSSIDFEGAWIVVK